MSAQLQGDVASAIGQQVEQMILQAKKDSETRVKHELGQTRTQLGQMETKIGELQLRVMNVVQSQESGAKDNSQALDQVFMSTSISQLEMKWGQEVKALKQDLHRTILAHNHNSDLMRHHRDALDEARRRLDLHAQPKAEQIEAQIEKVDRMLRSTHQKAATFEQLSNRMSQFEEQVQAYTGMSRGPLNPLMAQQAALDKKKTLAAAALASVGDGSSFNAEAPVFVPGGAAGGKPQGLAPGFMTGSGLEDLENDEDEDDVGDDEADDLDAAEVDVPPAVGPPPGL